MSVLLSVDNAALLSECEMDLQRILKVLHNQCGINGLSLSKDKSNVVTSAPNQCQ